MAARAKTESHATGRRPKPKQPRLSLLLPEMEEIVYVLGMTEDPWRSRVEFVSDRAEKATGFKPAAFRSNPGLWLSLIHPGDLAQVEERTRLIMASQKAGTRTYRLRNRSGEYRWIEDRVVPRLSRSGRVTGAIGVARDVTERERAEQALRESEERLLAQFKGIPLPTYSWRKVGEEFVLLDFNDAATTCSGGRISSLLGTTARALYPDRPDIVEDFARCVRERTTIRREMAYRLRLTNENRQFRVTYGFVPPDSVLVHAEDVTEWRRSTEALDASRRRLQALFDTALDSMVLVGDDAHYVDVNPAACALLGYSREELLRMSVWDIIPAPNRPAGQERWRQFIAAGALGGEYTARRKDGTTRELEFRAVANILPGLHLSVSRDITERKRAERDRSWLTRRFVELQEAERREVARDLHDDVGQLLTALKLSLEAGHGMEAEAMEIVRDLIARVRDLSMTLRPAMLDDLGLVPTLLWLVERYSGRTQVRVDLKFAGLDGRFPQALETTIFRIVQEALANVARHSGASQAQVELWADAERVGARIEDRGCGFDVAAALRGRTSGLAGMRERAERLGGLLTIESRPGAGARLSVELPLAAAAEGRE